MQQISDAFSQAGGHVTFFINGQNWDCIYDRADALKSAFAAGHQISSHTWSHADLTTLSASQIADEVNKLNVAFNKILGVTPTYFRPPYGSYNQASLDALQSLGMSTVVMWDIDSGDSLGASVSSQQGQYNSASSGVSHIFLQHETYASTASDMVPFIIGWAKAQNLQMVTVADCLTDGGSPYVTVGTSGVKDGSWVC
jgi:peptidoglycan/xylan/chitin deacetylase (PgdA/CDA1 family)